MTASSSGWPGQTKAVAVADRGRDIGDLVSRIRRQRDLRDLLHGHPLTGDWHRPWYERDSQIPAEHDDGPRDADHHDVESDDDSGPEVDLKDGPPQPYVLGLSQPALQEAHT